MRLYRETGVVLRTIRLGEADRIVTLLTPGRGKVRAVAKGVRKTKSKFGARLEPTSHVALLLYEGRELDIVTQAVPLLRPRPEDLRSGARACPSDSRRRTRHCPRPARRRCHRRGRPLSDARPRAPPGAKAALRPPDRLIKGLKGGA